MILTIGQPERSFRTDSHFLIDDFLQPVKKTAEYAQMNCLDYIVLYNVSITAGQNATNIASKARQHNSQNLINFLVKP